MTNEELINLMVKEQDANKAKAISSVVVAQMERETALAKVKADEAKTVTEKETELAKIKADQEMEEAKIKSEEQISRKDRILGWLKLVGTILLGLLTAGTTIFNARSVMKFEETGSIRTKAWTGVKPDKTQEIR